MCCQYCCLGPKWQFQGTRREALRMKFAKVDCTGSYILLRLTICEPWPSLEAAEGEREVLWMCSRLACSELMINDKWELGNMSSKFLNDEKNRVNSMDEVCRSHSAAAPRTDSLCNMKHTRQTCLDVTCFCLSHESGMTSIMLDAFTVEPCGNPRF